jgi:hypothetical protein
MVGGPLTCGNAFTRSAWSAESPHEPSAPNPRRPVWTLLCPAPRMKSTLSTRSRHTPAVRIPANTRGRSAAPEVLGLTLGVFAGEMPRLAKGLNRSALPVR